MYRASKVALCCATVVAVASAAAGQQSEGAPPMPAATATPTPTPTPAQTGGTVTYPPLPNPDGNPDLSLNLGVLPTVEQAVAAAKAANLAQGAYGVAIVAGQVLAIDAAGLVYHLAWLGGSGNGQRPPRDPKDQ